MCVAFGGFLFSPIPLLNQLGFFVVFAVLVDTFVVRPLLVPSIMALLGRANFWPMRLPPVTRPPFDVNAVWRSGADAAAVVADLEAAAAAAERAEDSTTARTAYVRAS